MSPFKRNFGVSNSCQVQATSVGAWSDANSKKSEVTGLRDLCHPLFNKSPASAVAPEHEWCTLMVERQSPREAVFCSSNMPATPTWTPSHCRNRW